jgi:hypothetical protein
MKRAAAVLLSIGLLQMAGDVFHLPVLKALAAATAASPAPKVFSSVQGLETYSTRFFIEWTAIDDTVHSVEITPQRAAGLRGPYNRRNVYGAVLSYGPILRSDAHLDPMFEYVSRYALCGSAPMLRELGIDPANIQGRPRIRLQPRPGSSTGDLPLTFEAPCP